MAVQAGGVEAMLRRMLSREGGRPILKPNKPLRLKNQVANKRLDRGGKIHTHARLERGGHTHTMLTYTGYPREEVRSQQLCCTIIVVCIIGEVRNKILI